MMNTWKTLGASLEEAVNAAKEHGAFPYLIVSHSAKQGLSHRCVQTKSLSSTPTKG